jgi:hypothetical protein
MEIVKVEADNFNPDQVIHITVSLHGKEREFHKNLVKGKNGTAEYLTCVCQKLYFSPGSYKFWVSKPIDALDALKTVLEYMQDKGE